MTGDRYLKTSASTAANPAYVQPFNKDYAPGTIGSTASGRVYAIEHSRSKSQENSLRLVSIAEGTSAPIPVAGWTENLLRGSDGNLYFRVFEKWHYHIFEVAGSGSVLEKAPCMWQNGSNIAVDLEGDIWQPGLLSIVQYDQSGHITKSVGPIAPIPCSITNTAALEPRYIIADQRGTVSFTYGEKLWQVDNRGSLSSINVPPGNFAVDAMVETTDGTLWIAETDWNHGGAIYRFIPAIQRPTVTGS